MTGGWVDGWATKHGRSLSQVTTTCLPDAGLTKTDV
jgi:hypothetical protein